MLQNKIKYIRKSLKRWLNMLLEPVIGYTRVVFATKFLLSSIVVILVLALIILPLISDVHHNFRLTFSSADNGADGETPTMVNPHFQGLDNEDRSYEISADKAIKMKDETLLLSNINANINLKDNSWLALVAKTGSFNRSQEYLELSDSINVFTDDGYELYTKSININMHDKSANGNSEIHAHGPVGSLTADSFVISDNGRSIVFKGNVKLTIYKQAI